MRLFIAAALLCASIAHADDEDLKTAAGIGLGAVGACYGVVQTTMMVDELLRKGYSEPSHTVPVGFIAAGSIIGSIGWFVNAWHSNSPIGMTGSVVAGLASATVMMLFAVSLHGWMIRQPVVDTGE